VVSATWKLRLQPTPPGWIDMALQAPIMDTSRARTELGWSPRHTSEDAFQELFEGMRESAGFTTAPLQSPRKMRSPAKREHLSP
jgi:nucleoside-diphosphate-sugar epimerase